MSAKKKPSAVAPSELSLQERRYKRLAERHEVLLDRIVKSARELARITPQLRRYEREFIRTGNVKALAMDGYEMAQAVLAPAKGGKP